MSITAAENGGTVYFDKVLKAGQGDCGLNSHGYAVCIEVIDFNLGLKLSAGTYWINLSHAQVTNGDPVYWDENSGAGCHSPGCPSQASENTVGTIPSESFAIGGGTSTTTSGTTPEPATVLLLASGIAAVGLLRTKF